MLVWPLLLLAGCQPQAEQSLVLRDAVMRPVGAEGGSGEGTAVKLPHGWNDSGLFGHYRYELVFESPAEGFNADWGLYLPRAGNRFQVSLNGNELAPAFGQADDLGADYAQKPHYLEMPRRLLRNGVNNLDITVHGEKARYAGLSYAVVGPASSVRSVFGWRETLQTRGSFSVVVTSLLFALAAIPLVWRLRDRATLLFLLACVFCALRTTYAVVDRPPLPYAWWALVIDGAYSGYILCLCAFCAELAQLRPQPIRALMLALVVLSLVAVPWYAFGHEIKARQFWLQGMVAFSVLLFGLVLRQWVVCRTREAAVLAMAGGGAVAMALHDHYQVFYAHEGYAAFALARYSLMLFLAAMGWLVLERLSSKEAALAEARGRMLAELAGYRQRLDESFDAKQAQAALTVQERERERILGDIHDGMGLQLQALLAQVEAGDMPRRDLALEVRTAIEQMRMLVSNAEQFDGDLLMLFGQIRHQLERRLKHCGIRLVWRCKVDPAIQSLSGAHCIALQRLVFELTTNVMRHANARTMTIHVEADPAKPDTLMLRLEDDGVGFDPSLASHGSGLRSIAHRVAELGGEGRFEPKRERGTRFLLRLPVSARPLEAHVQVA